MSDNEFNAVDYAIEAIDRLVTSAISKAYRIRFGAESSTLGLEREDRERILLATQQDLCSVLAEANTARAALMNARSAFHNAEERLRRHHEAWSQSPPRGDVDESGGGA